MCGRYSTGHKYEGLSSKLKKALKEYKQQSHYNAAPSQALPVVTNQEPGQAQTMQWGLVRSFSPDMNGPVKPINAKAKP